VKQCSINNEHEISRKEYEYKALNACIACVSVCMCVCIIQPVQVSEAAGCQ